MECKSLFYSWSFLLAQKHRGSKQEGGRRSVYCSEVQLKDIPESNFFPEDWIELCMGYYFHTNKNKHPYFQFKSYKHHSQKRKQ